MTLIASYINKYGIVLATDSNLTSRQGNSGFGQKVFPITYLNAGITYSGIYYIQGQDIDDWMNDFIRKSEHTCRSIEIFVETLTTQLNLDYSGIEEVAIMHICGYTKIDYESYVEHWHISNCTLEQETGNYLSRDQFGYSNDFNSRTKDSDREMLQRFDSNPYHHQFYINGFPPARISLMAIKSNLEGLLPEIAMQEQWSFRAPKNIFETANVIKMYFNLVSELFKMSDYNALFVGGETQTYLIPAPIDIKKNI